MTIIVTEPAAVSLFLALRFVMVASRVPAMGPPTVAAYLLPGIVLAPVLDEPDTSIGAAPCARRWTSRLPR